MAKKHRVRHTAAMIGRGLSMAAAKTRAMEAGIGAAAGIAAEFVRENVDFMKDNWWGTPAAILGASIFVKNQRVGCAMAGAAGAIGGFQYRLNQFQQGKSDKSPVPLFKKDDAKEGTKGLPSATDTGLEQGGSMSDAGLMFGAN